MSEARHITPYSWKRLYGFTGSREQEDGLEPCVVACDRPEMTHDTEDVEETEGSNDVSSVVPDVTPVITVSDSAAALPSVGDLTSDESLVQYSSLVTCNNDDGEDKEAETKSEDSGLASCRAEDVELNEPVDSLLTSQALAEDVADGKVANDEATSMSIQLDEAVDESSIATDVTLPLNSSILTAATSPSSQQVNVFRNRKTPRGFKYSMRCQCGAKNCRQFLC